jgi:hypothetical protein
MDNKELIKQIRDDLEEITPNKDHHEIQFIIHAITRNVNRLRIEDHKTSALLRRFAVDLMQIYTGEVKYWNLSRESDPANSNEKMKLTESFFRSVYELTGEMLGVLKEIG